MKSLKMDTVLALSVEKNEVTNKRASLRRTSGRWHSLRGRIMMKGSWWTWSVFVLEACNYNPERDGRGERIITWAPSPSDRRVGGGKKWKSQISSTSLRGAMTGKARHYYTFPPRVGNEKTRDERDDSSLPLSQSSSHLFPLHWSPFTFSSSSSSSFAPADIFCHSPPSLTWECVSRLLGAITIQNDKMEIIGVSQDQVKCNGPWKKAYVC